MTIDYRNYINKLLQIKQSELQELTLQLRKRINSQIKPHNHGRATLTGTALDRNVGVQQFDPWNSLGLNITER